MLSRKFITAWIILFITVSHVKADLISNGVEIKVEGFEYASLKTIPTGPNPEVDEFQCGHFVIDEEDLKFQQSTSIQESGWAVISETKLANIKLIAFAGQLGNGTSGSCLITQTNIAVLQDDNLVGVIYLDDPEAHHIGNLILSDAGYVRIFSGDFIQVPYAEMHLTENGLSILPTSKFTAYCKGQTILPDTLGQNIKTARQTLIDLGYAPVVIADRSIPDWRLNLLDEGIFEVEACSGTGFAFCRFQYQNDVSSIALVTAGEDDIPTVVKDMVKCD